MFGGLIDSLIEYANPIEGVLWVVIGVCFAVAILRPGGRGAKAVAAVNFVVFGCSDFVEYHTGAWWRPWWLLLWKAACVCIMVLQLFAYVRARRTCSGDRTQMGDSLP